ncbi:GDSL-type esterase/lipase family protein [Cumulibacter manganitolerans]|uniref:GDSL-type esterase/lipase family protein n=1 Tax=Cumulibacter manganitolerans TaxID=1884992 RepID=UPI001296FD28|nr:GDSL-type esterase/lipase family protein [Cumulibacter manganitolerans]
MNPQQLARSIALGAAATAFATSVGAVGVVATQLLTARRRAALDPRSAPDLPAEQGPATGPLLRVVILGDSFAAGVGAGDSSRSPAGRLTGMLARAGYRVQARSVAVPNSLTADVKIQASRALITSEADPYDLAIVVLGAMDVCAWSRSAEVEHATYRLTAALANRGGRVVLATTADLGTAPCVAQPLRALWGWRSRRIAAAQAAGARQSGSEVVDLVAATGTSFAGDRGLFAEDGFHPSADGYRIIADAIAPAVRAVARERRPIL